MTAAPGAVYRVAWVPGTDHLLGTCFCRAQHLDTDPAALWEWLHGHPDGHDPLPGPRGWPDTLVGIGNGTGNGTGSGIGREEVRA